METIFDYWVHEVPISILIEFLLEYAFKKRVIFVNSIQALVSAWIPNGILVLL